MTRATPSRRSAAGQLGDGHGAGRVLAAGHGDGAVVEDLVGDVAAGRHRGADGQRAGVEVGAVAEVLDEVVGVDERLDADPLRALAAHLRVAGDVPTRSGSISPTMPWQPMPPPTSAPSGTLVPVLWGQPEQKNGRAGRAAGRRCGGLKPGAGAGRSAVASGGRGRCCWPRRAAQRLDAGRRRRARRSAGDERAGRRGRACRRPGGRRCVP